MNPTRIMWFQKQKKLMGKLEEKGFEIRYCEDTFRLYLRSIGFFYRMLDRRLAIN
jgi:hypothetical protein